MSGPDFAIVGAPKTGTTALFLWLSEHPNLYLPPEKELHFFDLHREWGTDWYLEQFAPAGERLAGEATSTYLGHPTAIEELVAVNPEIRLIAIVRDPVARAWSDYHYRVARSRLSEPFASVALRELAGMIDGREQPDGLLHLSRYGRNLERASLHVPGERILVLRHRDLEDDPAGVVARTYAFLGVDASFRPAGLGRRANETHHVRYPRLHRALMRTRVDRLLGERGRQRVAEWLAERGYEPIDPYLRETLTEIFESDQRLLERFLEPASVR
jgi:hypothetical protein